jgi:hypothetical protein
MTAVYDVSHVAIYWKEQGMKSKLAILLAVGALMLVMTAATAYADNLLCQVGIACNGTPKGDVLTGTSQSDQIKGLGGRDRINDSSGNDIDTIDVREGNSSINNRDLVDCGKGTRDRVFFDTGDNGDKVARCEIKNP